MGEETGMDEKEGLAKAARLEAKSLYVKAAQIYEKLGHEEKAAAAYENGGDFEKAISIFEKLGKSDDAKRCRGKKEAAAQPETWDDLQAKFQADLPYQ